MAAQPIWKGHMKISLVTVPVQVFAATNSAAKIQFNQLHRKCDSRIKQKRWCDECDTEVAGDDIMKGYEIEKGRYVTLEDSDIERAKPESSSIIQITRVANEAAVDPVYIERPYYLAPDGEAGRQGFAVIREALAGRTGYGKVAISKQEYPVAIQARGRGIVMLTLRKGAEVRAVDDITALENLPEAPADAEIELARQVLGTLPTTIDLNAFHDSYQSNIKAMIDAKVAGDEYVSNEPQAPPPVSDLMAALQQSLAAGKSAARLTAVRDGQAEKDTARSRGRTSMRVHRLPDQATTTHTMCGTKFPNPSPDQNSPCRRVHVHLQPEASQAPRGPRGTPPGGYRVGRRAAGNAQPASDPQRRLTSAARPRRNLQPLPPAARREEDLHDADPHRTSRRGCTHLKETSRCRQPLNQRPHRPRHQAPRGHPSRLSTPSRTSW